jgi:mRNA-degrading endonuclease RelE of RelBE toxin-antitoxin system
VLNTGNIVLVRALAGTVPHRYARAGQVLRVGDWRVIFQRDDGRRVIDVLAVRARGGAYR